MLQTNYLHENFDLIDANGWALLDLPSDFCHQLLATAQDRLKLNQFKPAVVTESFDPSANLNENLKTIRSDLTSWLDQDSKIPAEKYLLQFLENLKTQLSQFFRFRLTEFECHFAIYEPGKSYAKHSDQTKQNNHRFFSFVIYLNENWLPSDGGQLRGYNNDKMIFEVQPQFGKMIVFKSDIEHEVMVANRQRWSLTGWFRK